MSPAEPPSEPQPFPPRILPDDEHNRRLVAAVHPVGRTNPRPRALYDLVVIGAGTAGLVTAAGAAGLGARVALIEKHLLGGDCLNVGCVPSKAMIAAARAAAGVRRAGEFGVSVPGGTRVDFPQVMERLRRLRAGISANDSVARFEKLGVDVFLGAAKFSDDGRAVEVAGEPLRFKRAAVCTGARPAVPDIPGLREAGFLTNETVFELTGLPPRLAVLGGGPIGCELAQAFARLGSRVTILQRPPQLLPREDADAARLVEEALRADGVEILTGADVREVRAEAEGHIVMATVQDRPHECVADAILVSTGRAPNVEGLNLEAAGIRCDAEHGIEVDDRLRTANRRVYAAGDVCSKYKFTHAADFLARIVIQNALFLGRSRASALTIPWCTYTSPEVAHVGLSAEEARRRGTAIDTFTQPLAGVDRAILDGETDGFVRVHVFRGTDRIAGATVVAAHAGEMISEITLAMKNGIGLKGIGSTIHPYPTQSEALRKLGDQYNRTRLTPFVKWLLGTRLRWMR